MDEMLFKVNSFAVYSFSLLVVFSFLWGSFVFYKKAIESHFEELPVLDTVVFIGFWSFIWGRVLFFIFNYGIFRDHWVRVFFLKDYPGISHWGLIIGLLFGLYLSLKNIKAKYVDWLDLIMLGVIGGLPIYFAGLTMISFSWFNLVMSVVLAIAFGFFWKAEGEYRTYSWYRYKRTQARSGFLSGSGMIVFGLVMLIVQLFGAKSLVEILLSVSLIVAGIVLVYIRSGRTIKEDIKIVSKYGRK